MEPNDLVGICYKWMIHVDFFFRGEHACDLAVINLTAIKWALGGRRKWHGLWKHRSYPFPWMEPAICHCVSVLWRVSPWSMISWMITTWGQILVQYMEGVWKSNLTRPCSLMAIVQERSNSIANALEWHLSCTNLSICKCPILLRWA